MPRRPPGEGKGVSHSIMRTAAHEDSVEQSVTAPNSRALGRRALLGGAAGVLAAPAVLAQVGAEGWPAERVTIVTSLPAGSTGGLPTRLLAERRAQLWGQPVVVDNRGGGNGVLACQMVARAKPDGLT